MKNLRELFGILTILWIGTTFSCAQLIINPFALIPTGGADYSPYLSAEGFEGVGFETPNAGNSGDPDYTTNPGAGLDSFRIYTTSSEGKGYYYDYTAGSTIQQATVCFMIRFNGTLPGGYNPFVFFQNVDGNKLGELCIGPSNNFYVQHYTIPASNHAGTVAPDTWYYVWFENECNTGGNNGKSYLYYSTSQIKPLTPAITLTAGSGVGPIRYLSFTTGFQNHDTQFDHVRVKEGPVGTVTNWPQ